MTTSTWTDVQWTQYAADVLERNCFTNFLGVRVESIQGEKACVFVDWSKGLGQLPENGIYNGGVPLMLADQAACISVGPKFRNINILTRRQEYDFKAPAPAGRRLYALAYRRAFLTNPNKPHDLELKGAEVDVRVFVKDYKDREEYVVGTSKVFVVWLGGPPVDQ